MQKEIYCRTDLAVEESAASKSASGVFFKEKETGGITVTEVTVENEEGARSINRPIGRYITLSFSPFWENNGSGVKEELISLLVNKLTSLLSKEKTDRLLIAGLGNRAFTADAIGPYVAERTAVTGHLDTPHAPSCRLFAFTPDVAGNTGMETLALIRGAVAASAATQVIVIDALASMSEDRLGKTIQLADTGIVPGSGVGNHRAALNRDTLGIPVIAIGVPFIVSSSTLVVNALEKAGVEELDGQLVAILENGRGFFVTPKDCDLIADVLAGVIAEAIMQTAERFSSKPT